jgi:hypothetical protein
MNKGDGKQPTKSVEPAVIGREEKVDNPISDSKEEKEIDPLDALMAEITNENKIPKKIVVGYVKKEYENIEHIKVTTKHDVGLVPYDKKRGVMIDGNVDDIYDKRYSILHLSELEGKLGVGQDTELELELTGAAGITGETASSGIIRTENGSVTLKSPYLKVQVWTQGHIYLNGKDLGAGKAKEITPKNAVGTLKIKSQNGDVYIITK